MKNLIDLLLELEREKLKKSETKNGLIITTSQRNELKRRFQLALEMDILEAVETAYSEQVLDNDIYIGETHEGLLVAPEHKDVPDTVPFKINVKVGNLDFDAGFEITTFKDEQAEKIAERKKKEQAKAEKIARDKELYEKRRIEAERKKNAE